MENRQQSGTSAPVNANIASRSSDPGKSTGSKKLSNRPAFTFIDHDDDLASKRIKDTNARKAIRSHVMRDVRRRERLVGLKRVSRREDGERSKKSDRKKSIEHSLPIRGSDSLSSSPKSPSSRSPSSTARPDLVLSTSQSIDPETVSFARFLDPFSTLPGGTERPSMTQNLVQYCLSVFIPMTFPTEMKSRDAASTLNSMVKSALGDSGSFYGLMTVSAAHRAAVTGRHSDLLFSSEQKGHVLHDPDYYMMKGQCIRVMNEKLQDPNRALSAEAFQTIVNLLSSALIVGLFDEARIHLRGLKRMVALSGGINDDSIRNSPIVTAILTSDLKAAAGLMTTPVFPLLWESQPLAFESPQRTQPPPSSKLNNLGSAFQGNQRFSIQLANALQRLKNVMLLQHLRDQDTGGLQSTDLNLLYKSIIEVEHELLSYPHRGQSDNGAAAGRSEISSREALARVTSICFLNSVIIVTPPSTGLGRALTKHLRHAIVDFIDLNPVPRLLRDDLDLLAWALFIAAQGALGQVEQPWFVSCIADVISTRRYKRWEEMADAMHQFFYIPYIHEMAWRPIWDEATRHIALTQTDTA